MARHEQAQLGITPWPGVPVPLPPIAHRPVTLVEGEFLWMPPPTTYREVPEELFLRGLLELEVDDPGQVAAFLDEFGMIAMEYDYRAVLPMPVVRVLNAAAQHPLADRARHVLHATWYLKTARALVRHWIAHENDEPLAPVWHSEEIGVGVQYDRDAWPLFAERINAGLRNYHARVEVPSQVLDGMFGAPELGLYSGLCLQLLNHIAEAMPARWCANETCGRLFVRQQGRAEYGLYHTKGVIYCSKSCARAQAQREYRRRNR